jgi:hypothetical protein
MLSSSFKKFRGLWPAVDQVRSRRGLNGSAPRAPRQVWLYFSFSEPQSRGLRGEGVHPLPVLLFSLRGLPHAVALEPGCQADAMAILP